MIDAQKIWSSKHLPSLPSVAVELVKLSKDPDSEIRDIISLVKTDPAISAKILKVVNSAFFGLSSQVTSLERAVGLLGTTYVTAIALSFYLSNSASAGGPLAEHYARYWLQSVVQATAAETLGKRLKTREESESFLAGLLLDLGRLAMLKTIPEQYEAVLTAADEQRRGLVTVEREQLGFDHCEIGARLMDSWGFPEILVDFVRRHHAEIEDVSPSEDSPESGQHRVLAVATGVGDLFCAADKAEASQRLGRMTTEFFGFKQDELEDFLQDVRTRIDQVSEQFSIQTNQLEDPAELMADAGTQLMNLAVRENVASMQAIARHQVVEKARQDLETKNQQLQKQTSHDPLTNIFNRSYFNEALAAEVKTCASTARAIGVIFCDIDDFKLINDTYGHQFGDEVLSRFARAVGSALRPSDIFARYGGDEFVVLVSHPTVKGLELISERIHDRFGSEEFSAEGRRISVTMSLGAAWDVPGRDDLNVEARIIAAADQEMYRSKNSRKNHTHIRSLVGDFQRRLGQLVTKNKFSRRLVAQGLLDVAAVSRALLQMTVEHHLIGQLAFESGLLDEPPIEAILTEQACTGRRFGEVALNLGLMEEEHVVDLLILQDEPPIALAESIGLLGLLDPQKLSSALEEYLKERSCVMQTSLQSSKRLFTIDA